MTSGYVATVRISKKPKKVTKFPASARPTVAKRDKANAAKYRVWACSRSARVYPMEYTVVSTQRAEATVAKKTPSGSARSTRGTPSARVSGDQTSAVPLSAEGIIAATVAV